MYVRVSVPDHHRTQKGRIENLRVEGRKMLPITIAMLHSFAYTALLNSADNVDTHTHT